jgi:hypothetical protein
LTDFRKILAQDNMFGVLPYQQRLFFMGRELKIGCRPISMVGLGSFDHNVVHLHVRPGEAAAAPASSKTPFELQRDSRKRKRDDPANQAAPDPIQRNPTQRTNNVEVLELLDSSDDDDDDDEDDTNIAAGAAPQENNGGNQDGENKVIELLSSDSDEDDDEEEDDEEEQQQEEEDSNAQNGAQDDNSVIEIDDSDDEDTANRNSSSVRNQQEDHDSDDDVEVVEDLNQREVIEIL